jgi:hypothetical protein
VLGQESSSIAAHTDTVSCVCDLTAYSCDSFCCCDSSCAPAVVSAWQANAQCQSPLFTDYSLVHCSKAGSLFAGTTNSSTTLDPLFKLLCVQYNNAPDWGIYHKLILTASDFSTDTISNTVAQQPQYSANLEYFSPTINNASLQFGSLVRAKYAWNAFNGMWSLPQNGLEGRCVNGRPVLWMQGQANGPCVISGMLQDLCAAGLSVDQYTSAKLGQSTVFATKGAVQVTVVAAYGVSSAGVTKLSGTPSTGYSSSQCTNAVIRADFAVITGSSQNTIQSAQVTLYVTNVQDTGNTMDVQQEFNVQFLTSTTTNSLSGNPGYIKGKPLITATGTASKLSFQGKTVISGGDTTGACTSSTSFYSPVIAYGQELVYSCSVGYDLSNLATFCASSANVSTKFQIFNALSFSAVAKFGNIYTTNNTDDWVLVTNSVPAGGMSWSSGNNSCILPGILVLDVIYTQVGPYDNPQDKVIYVNKYYQNTEWKYKFATTTTVQQFSLSVVVNYIPYQQYDDPYFLTITTSKLVRDNVVYPVTSMSSSPFFLSLLTLIFIF